VFAINAGIVVETKVLWEELQNSLKDFPLRLVFEQTQIQDWMAFAEKVQRLPPDIIFLDVTNVKDPGELIRRIRSLPQAPVVFALSTTAEGAAILDAIRAGAGEYLCPPFGDALRTGLDRVAAGHQARLDPQRAGAKVLAFLSSKGGCGATTIACHTALELPRQTNAKVLIADLDMDAGLVSFLLKTKSPYSMLDAAQNLYRLDASYWKALVSNGIPGLEMITAPANAPTKPVMPEQWEALFYFVRTQYDWIVLDLGRGLNSQSMACLQNCDETYLVTTPEIPALHQTKLMLSRLLEGGYGRERLRVLLNRSPKRMEVTVNELEKILGMPIHSVISDEPQELNDSYAEGKPVPPASKLGRSYAALAKKIAGVEEVKAVKKRLSLFG
jgi:pilus assembly protein CpaE